MIKIHRKIEYSNGNISISNSLEQIELVVTKENKILETKMFPWSICDNKVVLDNIISSLKCSYSLLYVEDDCIRMLSNFKKRVVIRGTGSVIHVLWSNDESNYIKQAFLPYNYKDLSLTDCMNLFGYL